MTREERLATIVTALEGVGIEPLVMGGHAVRYYGLHRDTDDFDLCITKSAWPDLLERLASCPLFSDSGPIEGDTWRKDAFRRFQIGRLPTGKEEWLEFWCGNHLLAPTGELAGRAVRGSYGGRELAFLGLADLIRSKETERDKDWRDVSELERFRDEQRLAEYRRGRIGLADALDSLRSRVGFEALLQAKLLEDLSAVRNALDRKEFPMSQAYLLPFVSDATLLADALDGEGADAGASVKELQAKPLLDRSRLG